VFDHLGIPPLPAGIQHPSHGIIRGLVDRGRSWVKLSGAYLNSKIGPPYPEATAIAQDFAKQRHNGWCGAAIGRIRRHLARPNRDDAMLFDLLSAWAPDEAVRHRILVENPETLYGFAKASVTMSKDLDRRALVGSLIVAGAVAAIPRNVYAQAQVPNSTGTEKPSLNLLSMPAIATTTSMTACVFRRAIRNRAMQSNASVAQYRLLQRRIGTARMFIVTPAPYVTDNRVTLDAIAQIGPNARGVAVVRPNVTDAELRNARRRRHPRHPVHAGRSRDGGDHTRHDRSPWRGAWRCSAGNVQVHMLSDQIVASEAMVESPAHADRVRSHGAGMRPACLAQGPRVRRHPPADRQRRTWGENGRRLSQYEQGPPRYADATALAAGLRNAAPERLVGVAIGPIRPRRPARSQMTRCYSICWRNGCPMRPHAIAFRRESGKASTASRARLAILSSRSALSDHPYRQVRRSP